jgi:glucose-6-phosphate 1-epimerase
VPYAFIDRIYFDAPAQLELHSALGTTHLEQSGFQDTVVWNPGGGSSGAAALPPDLPQDGFKQFLCVEAACIGRPVQLDAAQVWRGTQKIRAAVAG